MKSRLEVLVSTIACLVLFLSKGDAADDTKPNRNVRVKTVSRDGAETSIGSRIHGGSYAVEGQFKYMVFLLSYNSKDSRQPSATCSASLIDPSWVLTAAHCVSPAMIAVAGRANLVHYWESGRKWTPFRDEIDEKKFEVQERKVRQVFAHPGYSTDSQEKDLALLFLDRPFDTAFDHVAPVVALSLTRSEMHSEMACTAIGWGLNDNEIQTFRLMFASPVYAKTAASGCKYLKDGPFICLKMGGAGICKGDSGSPLVCQEQAWGVASFSLSPNSDPDYFSIGEEYYSQIYPELKWIRETMENGGTTAVLVTRFVSVLPLLALFLSYPIF